MKELGKKKMVTTESNTIPMRRPALTPEARENQMIAYAVDLAEKQLREGTASSQVITHYLKLGSSKERLEREKLERENELLRAKAESLQSAQRSEEVYEKALQAMRSYSGQDYADVEDYDDDY
jgi:hypothetical protein